MGLVGFTVALNREGPCWLAADEMLEPN
jgi:hypothetical protein